MKITTLLLAVKGYEKQNPSLYSHDSQIKITLCDNQELTANNKLEKNSLGNTEEQALFSLKLSSYPSTFPKIDLLSDEEKNSNRKTIRTILEATDEDGNSFASFFVNATELMEYLDKGAPLSGYVFQEIVTLMRSIVSDNTETLPNNQIIIEKSIVDSQVNIIPCEANNNPVLEISSPSSLVIEKSKHTGIVILRSPEQVKKENFEGIFFSSRTYLPVLSSLKNKSVRKAVQLVNSGLDDTYFNLMKNKNFYALANPQRREDIYVPFSWRKSSGEKSGAYINPYIFGKKNLDPNKKPSTLVTGMCLFGTNLTGIDQHGDRYNLCDPKIKIPENKIIIKTEVMETFHGDELLWQEFYDDIIPYINSKHINKKMDLICFIPDEAYILKMVDTYINSKITYECLLIFIENVLKRGKQHLQYWNDLGNKHNVNVIRTYCTGDLIDVSVSPEEIINNYFQQIGVDPSEISTWKSEICTKTMESLKNGKMGDSWKKIDNLDKKELPTNMEVLGNIGYSVYLETLPLKDEPIIFIARGSEKHVLLQHTKISPDYTNQFLYFGIFPHICPDEERGILGFSNLGEKIDRQTVRKMMDDTNEGIEKNSSLN